MSRFPKLSFLSLSLLFASSQVQAEFHPSLFPFMPRVLGEGFFGDETLGEADAMVPLFGNHGGIFYIDGLGKTGDDDGYLGSFGGGYRGIYNDRFLWGAYVFGDFNRVARGPHFPVVNPGLELMTNYWDIHVNGYFPTSPKQKVEGRFLGEQLGTTQYISFTGHNQFDNLINLVEEVGNGVDGEVGLTLPVFRNLRFYTGGYHFSFKEARDINGIIGGVEMPLNNYFTVSLRDSYDRVQRNTAQLGIRLTLGAMEKGEQPKVEDRLLDPIRRHLGTWNTGSGIPSQQAYVNTGVRVLTRDNIWFFSSAGTPFVAANGFSNCTYENNCLDTSFSQTTVDAIDAISPAANLYLGPGNYGTFSGTSFSSSAVVQQADFLTTLSLNPRQSVYGRGENFTVAGLRVLKGSLTLINNNTVDSIFLVNSDGEFTNGLRVLGANNRITNSIIGTNNAASGFKRAVTIESGQLFTLENSRLEAFSDSNIPATGILMVNASEILINNVSINVNAIQQNTNSVSGEGINILESLGKVSITNSRINVQVKNSAGQNSEATGISIDQNGSIANTIISNSQVSVNSSSHGSGLNSTSNALGISVEGKAQVVDSSINTHSLNETTNGISTSSGYQTVSQAAGSSLEILRSQGTVTAQATGLNSMANATGLLVSSGTDADITAARISASAQATLESNATGINATAEINEPSASIFFTGIDITSTATSANTATAIALRASHATINEVATSNGTFLPSTLTAQATGTQIALAKGAELNVSSRFNNDVTSNRRIGTHMTYNVAATGNNARAIGVEAVNSSSAVLFNSALSVTANNTPGINFLSSENSVIRDCSFFGLALTGTCPVVGK
ncbi:hypothetical protein A8135_12545 [Legionella jamestowniensis]|uniref:Inverse autotransporter beta-domain domain-containing protein n=1 Tax=Legionella jamestowniensis TaxID=455 RepID=A0ABX2XUQ9_9GAMM|nr:inverse autotransporter beta domain-containing protein [Legionella jamestowniensis]OCH98374.1 hypothetical protein A8135_12545 [Legionella jamestowniensis]